VDPVGHGTFQTITVSVNLTWELTLESWENIIEGESVSGKVNPARVCCKESKSLTGPETLGVAPFCDIWALFLGIGSKVLDIEVPVKGTTFLVQVLLKNAEPLLAVNVLFEGLVDLIGIQCVEVKGGSKLDVTSKLVPRLVMLVLEGTTFKLNNSSESVQVVDGSCSSDFGTETVTSNSCHSNFLFIHESHDIIRQFLYSKQR